MSYRAPIAPMMVTPSTRAPPTGNLQPVGRNQNNRGRPMSPPRTRSNGKSTQDFQAQADRMEEVRDLADPDYRESQTTPRKRRATDDISPKSTKRKSPGHMAFESLKDGDSIKERRKHLTRIHKHWGRDTEQWMPESVWPCKFIGSGKSRSRRLIMDPRDWNSPLLEELSYLSAVTKNKPAVAFQALEEAILQRQEQENSHDETQVLKEDVQHATQICKAAEGDDGAPGPAPPDEDVAVANETEPDVPADVATHGLPDRRSPTFAGDATVVKVESQAALKPTAAASLLAGGWSGYEDEMDKLEEARLEAEEKEALAAARRAQREHIAQRRRVREMMRQHGRTSEDAILLGSDQTGL